MATLLSKSIQYNVEVSREDIGPRAWYPHSPKPQNRSDETEARALLTAARRKHPDHQFRIRRTTLIQEVLDD